MEYLSSCKKNTIPDDHINDTVFGSRNSSPSFVSSIYT